MQKNETIIIIGGGAAGLIAAKELKKYSKDIIVLEALDRLGGRIHTLNAKNSSLPIEAGAEFIHGNLPITLSLLKEYKLSFKKTGGKMVNLSRRDSAFGNDENNIWEKMIAQMKQLKVDLSLSDFLTTYFPEDKYDALRKSAEGFANGFDLADPKTASVFALSKEWGNEEHDQFRMEGGYKKLVDALQKDCSGKGCVIHTSEAVKKIEWKKNEVVVSTEAGNLFSGSKAIITIPVGCWHANPAVIEFAPDIPEKIDAFNDIGFGSIIKIVLEFENAFWQEKYKNLGFLITKETIPTWWSPSS